MSKKSATAPRWSTHASAATTTDLLHQLAYEDPLTDASRSPSTALFMTLFPAFAAGLLGVLPALVAGALSLAAGATAAYVTHGVLLGALVLFLIYFQVFTLRMALAEGQLGEYSLDDLTLHLVAYLLPLVDAEQAASLRVLRSQPDRPGDRWRLLLTTRHRDKLTVEFALEADQTLAITASLGDDERVTVYARDFTALRPPTEELALALAQACAEQLHLRPDAVAAATPQGAPLTWRRAHTPQAPPSPPQRAEVTLQPRYRLAPYTDLKHPSRLYAALWNLGWLVALAGCVAYLQHGLIDFAWLDGLDPQEDVSQILAGSLFSVAPPILLLSGGLISVPRLPRLRARPISVTTPAPRQLTLDGARLQLQGGQAITVDLEQPFRLELSQSTDEHGATWVHIDLLNTDALDGPPQRLRLSTPGAPQPDDDAMPTLEVEGLLLPREALLGWLWPAVAHFAAAHGEPPRWTPEASA